MPQSPTALLRRGTGIPMLLLYTWLPDERDGHGRGRPGERAGGRPGRTPVQVWQLSRELRRGPSRAGAWRDGEGQLTGLLYEVRERRGLGEAWTEGSPAG